MLKSLFAVLDRLKIKELQGLKPLLMDFIASSPAKTSILVGLMILGSLTSGIGILLIIPLLSSIGIDLGGSHQTEATNISEWVSNIFLWFGIDASLETVLALYLFVITTVALISYANTVLNTKLRMQFVDGLRTRLFGLLVYSEWQFLTHERMSDFARMVTGQVQAMGHSIQQLLTLISRLILTLVYLSLAFLLSPVITIFALFCGLILIAILLPLNKHIHQSGRIELKTYADIYHSAFEQLSSLKIIKSFSSEQRYLEKMQGASKILESQQTKIARYNALSRLVNLTGSAIIFILLLYASIKIIELPTANLILILLIFSRLMPQLSAIQISVQQLIHSAPEYVDFLLKSDSLKECQEKPPAVGNIETPSFHHEIELKELEYSYPNKNMSAFSGLNAKIVKNQTVAICGPSGAGKSTLADIIAGLIAPVSGQFLVDGIEIDSINRLAWRSSVAYVTQDVFLFHDSIRNNLSWVTQETSDEQLWECLTLAAADTFVRALPQGLDTHIGDRGTQLSGGEKQRLALARALISEPEILILDEATSALDKANQGKIKEALDNLYGKLTIVVIAHNQASIEHISQRIELSR